jgi:hypothetical protein
LRLLDVGMAEHQLNRADVHVLRQEATRAFVTQVVPMQVDFRSLARSTRAPRAMANWSETERGVWRLIVTYE